MRISRAVARRFLLGRHGIWPGRRWRGLRGTEQAMRTMEHLQLDPLQIVARAQDLALQARVLDYALDDWQTLTYGKRRFFEWGGWLAVRPIEELRYYRALMRRSEAAEWMRWIPEQHPEAVAEMRRVLSSGRAVSNRDFAMGERTRVDSYRGRKDSAIALHYLWRIGEAVVVRRTPTFERVYAATEKVIPRRHLVEVPEDEADDFLIRKSIANAGLSRLNGIAGMLHREMPVRDVRAWRDRGLADGSLLEVEIEGLRQPLVAVAADGPALAALARNRLPRGWKPLEVTTADEVTFLSPLDPVIHDRERTRALWDFDYKWGVYDKVEKRKFGYYDLPILWGDALVGRADMKLDRPSQTLVVLNRWLEDAATADDPAFVRAYDAGLDRLAGLVGATSVSSRG